MSLQQIFSTEFGLFSLQNVCQSLLFGSYANINWTVLFAQMPTQMTPIICKRKNRCIIRSQARGLQEAGKSRYSGSFEKRMFQFLTIQIIRSFRQTGIIPLARGKSIRMIRTQQKKIAQLDSPPCRRQVHLDYYHRQVIQELDWSEITPPPPQLFGPTVEIPLMGPQLFSG